MLSIKKFIFSGIILASLLMVLTLNHSPSQAATADTAKWYIHAHVNNGQLNVEWVVETGYLTGYPQQWNKVNSSRTTLKCFTQGNPVYTSNSLYLNGQSSIKCAVPSFADEVKRLSNGSINLEPILETQSILTEVDAKVGLSRGSHSNPIFIMEDNLELFIPKGKATARMLLTYPGGQTNSGKFTVWGRDTFKIEETCASTTCQFDHSLSSSHIASKPAPFTINLPTDESSVVIGYSAIHKTYFEGEIFDLFVDPFARGPGSG